MSQKRKTPNRLTKKRTWRVKANGAGREKGCAWKIAPLLEQTQQVLIAREIFVAVPPGRDEHPVRVFSTFTEDLEAQWLVSCGITTVAMESTGVYWIRLYDVVEQHGMKACLVDARGMKTCRGGARTGT